MGLKFDLRTGDELRLDGGKIVVTLLEKSGQRARIVVEADDSVQIRVVEKQEAHEKILAGAV